MSINSNWLTNDGYGLLEDPAVSRAVREADIKGFQYAT